MELKPTIQIDLCNLEFSHQTQGNNYVPKILIFHWKSPDCNHDEIFTLIYAVGVPSLHQRSSL